MVSPVDTLGKIIAFVFFNVYVTPFIWIGLAAHLWRVGRRIDALEDALEAERELRRAARSTNVKAR